MEIWGEWVDGGKASGKFVLTYAGNPSQFEGKTTPPEGINEIKLQISAVDRVGNSGLHTLPFHIIP